MTYSRSASRAAHRRLPQQAWALEPRMMFDAAAVATAEAVVAATDTAPGVTASGAEATVTIDESSGSQSVDMFSGVSVTLDNSSESLSSLVITVDSSGGNQALIIDGSAISLETGSGATTGKSYFYSVAVSGNTTTVTIALDSVEDTTASDVASLIDGIAYSTLDNTVESGTVTVTLSTLSDNSDTAQLGISSTITIDSQINVAPVLSDDGALEAAESITVGDIAEVVYSGDGNYAYAAGEGVVAVFSIDDGGRLMLADTLAVDGMSKATEMVISADDRSIYVIDGSSNVYVFSVGDDGKIDNVSTVATDNGDVTGGMAIADDDAWVYVGTESNGVVIYSRDAATGALTYVGRAPDDNSREGVIAAAGDYVYVIYSGAGNFGSVSLSVYQRNDDGSLDAITNVTVSDLDTDWDNIDWNNPNYTNDVSDATLAVSADGQYLYIAAPLKEVVLIYQFRDNALTQLDTLSISGISSIALSDEDGLLYAVSVDGGISVFSVAGDGALTLSSRIAGGGSDIAISADGLSILVAGGSVNRYTSAQTLDQGEALTFAAGLTLKDSNYDVLSNGAGNYNGAGITVSANVDTGSYGFADGNGLSLSNGVISLDGSAIAALSASDDGVLTVIFTADATTAVANQVLQQLTYANAGATVGSFIQLSVIASDATLASSAVAITLRVNAAPQVNIDASTGYSLSAATSETPYSFTLFSGLFGDADGDSLTWSVSGLPEGLTFDATTRTISGAALATGSFIVTVTVTDVSGASAALELDLTVEQIANRAPEINENVSATLAYATEGAAYGTTLDSTMFSDADSLYGDSLTWRVSGLPDGFTFDAATLTISGSSSAVGDYTVTVTATDESGAGSSVELTLRVITTDEANNSAPSLDADDSELAYTVEGNLTGFSQYVYNLELSSDDRHLIVLGNDSNSQLLSPSGNSTLYVYSRDSETGNLTLVQTFVQGTADDGDDSNGIEINGLDSATSAIYSADGKYVYLVGKNAAGVYAITVLGVNEGGALSATDLSVEITDASQIKGMAASDDGDSLYIISSNTLYAYSVGENGNLTLAGAYSDSYRSSDYTAGASAIVIDNASGVVYVAGDSRIVVYTTNDDGTLTYATTYTNGLSNFMRSMVVSDSGYLYVATGAGGKIVTLHYDSDANSVTQIASISVANVWGVSLSADGTALYAGYFIGNIYVYRVNEDGSLSQISTLSNSSGRANRFAVSSDGSSIYYGGFYNAAGLGQISAGAVAASYTEGAAAQPLTAITLSDADYDALNGGAGNYNGASITLARAGGADAADSYSFSDGNGLTLADGVISLNGTAIGTFVSADGTLTVTFTTDVTTATANLVLRQIGYSNTSSDPGGSIALTLTVADQYASSSLDLLLNVTEINDAPIVETTGGSVVYTSGGNAVKLFDDSAVSTVEAGQQVSSVTLTVSGLTDGESETLTVGGISVALIDGASASGSIDVAADDGSTVSYGYTLAVSVVDGIATVTLSGNLPAAATATLLDSVGYANSSDNPTLGARTITLTSIQDSGGTDNGGVNSTTLAIASTVTVSLTNAAPAVAATGNTATFTENGEAVALFDGVTLSTTEPGQAIANITLTVSGLTDGASETLTLDGSVVALVDGSGVTAGGYSYSITLEGGTAIVVISDSDGIAVDDATALIAGLSYANQSDDPTAATRTITLTSVQDDGGTANGGSDTVSPAIAASITVVAVNDAPVIDATAADVTYATSGSNVSLFSDVSLSTVESGQTLSAITFTVSGLLDGGNESLTVSGTRIGLVDGSGTLDNGYAYSVTLDGDTATVTIVSDGGIAADAAIALIEQTRYANLSNTQTAGVRTIALSVRDSGGQDNGGSDTAALQAVSSVDVVNNSVPELSAAADYTNLDVAASLTAISGLADITAGALTTAGDYLYVVSSDGDIAVFSRNAHTGELALLQTLDSGVSSVSLIEVSDDGGTVFMLGADGGSVTVFSRDSRDGSLTLVQTLTTENVVDLTLSADGSALYVVDGNYSGLLVYTLDTDSGQYALSQSVAASTSSEPYLFTAVGIEVVGDYVYVITNPAAETVANTLIVYQRATDGTLSAVAWLRDGAAAGEDAVAMSSPVAIAVAGDGGTIYVASQDGVAAFSLDAASGALSYLGAVGDLSNVTDIALSGDDGTLYVTRSDGSINRYKSEGGTLTLIETLSSASTAALAGAQRVATGAHGAVVVIGSGGVVSLKDALTQITIDYHEQGTVLPADVITLSDADYDALADGAGNYNGAVITLVREGGANGDDGYGFVDGNGLTLTDGTLYLDGAAIADFTSDGGALTLTFTADVTGVIANRVLQQISYTNASDDPGASIRLAIAATDAYAASVSAILALNVTEVNDAPVLNATPADTVYVEGAAAAALFSNAGVSTVEAGQALSALTLSVSGLSDGDNETLTLDGGVVALVDGSGVTASGYAYSISLSDGIASVVISSATGISAADAAILINGMAYANASDDPTAGARTVTLTAIQDNGGLDNGGSDTAALNIVATVGVTAVNNAPVLTTTPTDASYAAGDNGAPLFDGTHVSTVEDGQSIAALTITVSGVVDAAESLLVDGTTVTLTDGVSVTTVGGLNVTVAVDQGTATLIITSNAGLSQADAQALIDGLTYANTDGTVSTGERVISLTAVRDDGGTAAGGENTTALSIAARVNIVNSAPQATDAEVELPTATRAAAYSATLSGDLFSDVNGDTLSWRVDGLPDGLGFDPDTRTISGRTLAVGSFELTVTVSDGQGGTATRNLTLAVDKQPVSPVFLPLSNAPGMMERGWDARQEEERPEEAIGGASRPVTRAMPSVSNLATGATSLSGDALSTERYPLVNGEMDYAATPWQLDPVMATLMPPLDAVDFSSLRTTPENARLGQQMPQSDGPDAKVAFSAQLQQEQSAYQAQKEYDELLNALSQLTENTASPAA
ncbi:MULTISPECIES: putative Ig domain-containing protein [unclassified Brenneria]|uniref:putative Ig domain-containing protein n=1 Tax=unclassified Brenneria TaxID=2634434 RepID=UPI0018F08141|nr:putative Ig domain-containing protein [Brenneria sp. L3-3C-1]MBJ7222689.1 beta-propeller fold lactonase family protein [Brenneria sp. L3-3C-1]MEE3643932.1 putative Ig domain-containing protein [Brenneria sp. L3_3C_1]